MFARDFSIWPAFWLLALLAFTACRNNLPDTNPTTGTVTYQGEPVAGATVLFIRGGGTLAAGELAMGETDAQGRFELTTYVSGQQDASGAMVGEYVVTISKHIPPRGMSESQYQALVDAAEKIGETGEMVPPEKQPPDPVEMFPERYSMLGKSELRATVTDDGQNDFRFDLE